MNLRPSLITLAIALALPQISRADVAERKPTRLQRTDVSAEVPADPKFPQISKEIEDGQVLSGKKTTEVKLGEQPAIANNELRQTFAKLPGLLLSEQQIPSHFNVNYRGLGDPHESEFVMFYEDGVPLASGWFGYPTMYYLPPTERLAVRLNGALGARLDGSFAKHRRKLSALPPQPLSPKT